MSEQDIPSPAEKKLNHKNTKKKKTVFLKEPFPKPSEILNTGLIMFNCI